jgi:hypothetical protein
MDAITDAYMDWSLRTKDEGLGVLLEPHPDEMVLNSLRIVVIDVFSTYSHSLLTHWLTGTA